MSVSSSCSVLASDMGWTKTDFHNFQICSLTTSESGLTSTCHCHLDGHGVWSGSCLSSQCVLQDTLARRSMSSLCAPRCCARNANPRSPPLLARQKQSIELSRETIENGGGRRFTLFGSRRGHWITSSSCQKRGPDLSQGRDHETNGLLQLGTRSWSQDIPRNLVILSATYRENQWSSVDKTLRAVGSWMFGLFLAVLRHPDTLL